MSDKEDAACPTCNILRSWLSRMDPSNEQAINACPDPFHDPYRPLPPVCSTCGGRGWHTAGGNDETICNCPAGEAYAAATTGNERAT